VTRLALAAVLVLALLPSAAVAKPAVCSPEVIQQALMDDGKLTAEDLQFGTVVDRVRCGDITDDAAADALFTIASGGTAGDTRFGVLRGNPDGSPATLVLFRSGYKLGVARRNARSFAVIQPHYGRNDANCCPSSFRIRRYAWTGTRFRAGKARKSKTAPRRFYRLR
jgi:hypothetical protein